MMLTPTDEPEASFPEVSGAATYLLALSTGLAVFGLASLAVHFRPEGSSMAAWWPAAGVAVAAVAMVAPRGRPVVVTAVGAGALAANLEVDRPWIALLGFSLANALMPWLWVNVMTRGRDVRPQLVTMDDFGRFVLATLTATGAGGLLAALSVQASGEGDALTTLGTFVAAHSASVLILVPCFLPLPAPVRRPSLAKVAIQAAALVAAILVVYGPQQDLPLSVLPLPFLLWGAVRMPARWVAVELLVAGVLTSVLTTLGYGPYAAVADHGYAPELVGLLLQLALLVYAMVTLPPTLLVHRQRAALHAARDSYELVRSVLTGATGTAIIGCNQTGTITLFNTGAEDMLGYAAEDVVGRCTPERFHVRAEIEARARELGVRPGMAVFTAVVDSGAPSERRDWTMVRRDGTRLTVALRFTPRLSESGTLLGYLALGEDVTERRRSEAKLRDALDRERQALERMEQLDKAKTQFVSTVSHELRTPMTSVLGYTDMVLGETAGPVNSEQRAMLEAAQRNGHRLLRLIEDLLTVSLIEHGRFAIDAEAVDLRTAARGAVEAVRPLIVDRQLELGVDLGPDELMVIGDLDHLERVAINLLANAVKFTPDGGRIDLRLGTQGDDAFLEVADTGIGIPEDEQPMLFERFFRSTTAQELEVPGTGLGLSIVQAIVSAHGGHIDVRSQADEGATFRIGLPLRQHARL